MANLAKIENIENIDKIDKIITEVNGLQKNEKIIFFHKIEKIFDNFDDAQNEDVSIESVFSLWKDRDISKESLREKAWIKDRIDNKQYIRF